MDETQTCPHCAETIHTLALVCRHCGHDLAPQGVETEPKAKRNWRGIVALGILVVLLLVVVFKVGVYTSQPIGSLSEGRTLIVWRVSGEQVPVVGYEEPSLEQRFGEEYRAHCRSVPRWLPRIPPQKLVEQEEEK